MKTSVYSRWDGSQEEYRLDAESALDALSDLMMEGLDASEALEWGLANKLCENDRLMDDALATAECIAGNAPISTRQAKKSISIATEVDLKNGYAFEIEAYNRMVGTEDRLEGIRAFNEKRRPEFKGR